MKEIPNAITSVRLVAAIVIMIAALATPDHGVRAFLPLFIAAGISDMLDGFIARRFDWCTEFGARLDSVSDLTLYASVVLCLAINFAAALSGSLAIVTFCIGATVQIFHLWYSFKKFGCFPSYHTDFTRLCAYGIFFGVIAFWLTHSSLIMPGLALIWTSCSIEGIVITRILKKSKDNVKGIRAIMADTLRE